MARRIERLDNERQDKLRLDNVQLDKARQDNKQLKATRTWDTRPAAHHMALIPRTGSHEREMAGAMGVGYLTHALVVRS